eukprot:2537198-Rhodomonas_salina.4
MGCPVLTSAMVVHSGYWISGTGMARVLHPSYGLFGIAIGYAAIACATPCTDTGMERPENAKCIYGAPPSGTNTAKVLHAVKQYWCSYDATTSSTDAALTLHPVLCDVQL